MTEQKKGLTYAEAGVDIAAANRAVDLIRSSVRRTLRPEVLTDIGGFGGLFALDTKKYKEPVLVSGTDGVGTKLRAAFMMDRHNTVGIDLVAMCVNDILVQGAEPLFFLDYLAVGKLEPERVSAVVEGIAEGCRLAGCALIGGETAEMPGFYGPEEYDIAGFAVGVVERSRIVDGSAVREGDVLLGLPSSGLHSNGFSLARKALLELGDMEIDSYRHELGRTVGEELLVPTRIYVRSVLPLLGSPGVHGMAHITGGGITENLPRILPGRLQAVVERGSWPVPPVFELIREAGGVAEDEMYRTFNMGIGFVLVTAAEAADEVADALRTAGEQVYRIGRITAGTNGVEYIGK